MATVLVTGASSGMGEATAERFAGAGHRVILAARRRDRVAALAQRLGERALAVELDVRDRASVDSAVAGLGAGFADVDILVNNAGLALGLGSAAQADLDDWQQMIETNCLGLAYMTRALLPAMIERGSGHVVNVGSIAGSSPYPGANVYGATKAFVHQFTLNLRSDLHGTGVRATCIEPGLVGGTEFSLVRFDGDQERVRGLYDGANALTPQDVAESIFWATSMPAHVNVNSIEIMPVTQSHPALQVFRDA